MRLFKTSAGFALILLVAGLAIAQKVTTDFDRNTDFSKYRTFMWIKEPVEAKDPLMRQRLIEGVNAQLTAKGLQLVTADADLGVSANVATQEKRTLNTFYDGFGRWGWGMGGNATTTVDTYEVGTLVVDLFDTKTKQVVWRGTATDTVPDKPKKQEEKIEKALQKMFKDFPPDKKVTAF
ncbi:MAG TPA: DUF4136 domain-containing protein [Terriglobia bacterium]|nr:DUF4136 domain-containing protein [Terriglobia bacterium]